MKFKDIKMLIAAIFKKSLYRKNNKIEFKNGSTIEILTPKNEGGVIRGKRSGLPMWLYDYECLNEEKLNEVLKPFINNKERLD